MEEVLLIELDDASSTGVADPPKSEQAESVTSEAVVATVKSVRFMEKGSRECAKYRPSSGWITNNLC